MLVNPISFRLSISLFWKSTWSLYKYNNYKYLFYSDIAFFEYFCFFFKKLLKSDLIDYSISHLRFSRWNNNLLINIYYYCSMEDLKFCEEKKKPKHSTKTKTQKDYEMIKNLMHLTKKLFLTKKYKNIKQSLIKNIKILIFKFSRKFIIYKLLKPFWFKKKKKIIINKIQQIILLKKKWKKKISKKINKILLKKLKKYAILTKQMLLKKNKKIVNNNIKKFLLKDFSFYVNKFFRIYFRQYRNFCWKKLSNINFDNLYLKKKENKIKKKKIIVKKNLLKRLENFLIKVKKTYKKNNKLRVFIFKNKYFKKIKRILYNNIKKKIKIVKNKKKRRKKLKVYLKLKNKLNLNLFFLSKISRKKINYNYKYLFYGLYLYILSKFLKNDVKFRFLNNILKFKVNLLKITFNAINAKVIGIYIKTSLRMRYSLWETIKPILADLNKRLLFKQIGGFKLSIIGRFKRVSRAVYWWRKNGAILAATTTAGVDFERIFYRTKYGISTINVWLTSGINLFKTYIKIFPRKNPFFFNFKKNIFDKVDYFFFKKNSLFFWEYLNGFSINYSFFNSNYFKNVLLYILDKFFYINIFLKNIYDVLKLKKNDIKYFFKKIFLPQYCVYKINVEDFFNKNIIKIIPYVTLNVLKRINVRNSYKVYFIKNSDANIKLYKYNVFL